MEGKLTVVNGKYQGAVTNFSQGRVITIGRSKRCSLSIKDSKISSMHCQVDVSDKECLLKDLGSTNGCCVNGKKVKSALLHSSDIISLGDIKILVEYDANKNLSLEAKGKNAEITEVWGEEDMPIPCEEEYIQDYKILKKGTLLGENTFQAEHRNTQDVVMLWRIEVEDNSEAFAKFTEKAKVYYSIENPRVLRTIEVFQEPGFLYFALEYIQGNTLYRWAQERKKISLSRALKTIAYTTSGVNHLHKNGISQVTPSPHFIVVEEVTKKIKLFLPALPLFLEESGYSFPPFETDESKYPSPYQKEPEEKSDLYSLGAILFFLISGFSPELIPVKGEQALSWLKENYNPPQDIQSLLSKVLLPHPQIKKTKQFYDEVTEILNEIK